MTLLYFNSSTVFCNPYHITDHCATVGFTITHYGHYISLFWANMAVVQSIKSMNHKQNEINSLLHIGKTQDEIARHVSDNKKLCFVKNARQIEVYRLINQSKHSFRLRCLSCDCILLIGKANGFLSFGIKNSFCLHSCRFGLGI